jgi:hypothetical protein
MTHPPDWTRYMRHLEGCSIFKAASIRDLTSRACDCGMLKAQARQVDRIYKLRDALTKIGHYTAAHDNVIDASWVAKVIDEAMTLEGN